MPEQKEIYCHHTDQYELLASYEDYQENIFRMLEGIRSYNGLDVVYLGAGTGRLACMLAPVVSSMIAFDISEPMLEVTINKLIRHEAQNWMATAADHRYIPLADQSVDVVVSGWSVCYLVVWFENTWRDELDRAFKEMKRVLRQGGTIILLETLGTGHERPTVLDSLGGYFQTLKNAGFKSTWMRTDYLFPSLVEADTLTSFFFGKTAATEMLEKILEVQNGVILPECTGIWWLSV